MDIDRFIEGRKHRWQRLSNLLDRVERGDLSVLNPSELHDLFRLYRLTSSDLNYAQTATGNPALLSYLEDLVGRCYAMIRATDRPRPLHSWLNILRTTFPRLMRRRWGVLLVSACAMLAGMFFGAAATLIEPDMTRVFLPGEHLLQTPAERVATLEALERGGGSQIPDTGSYAFFSSFLFTHNIRVSILAFALGLTFGIGTVVVLFYNGVIIGSIAIDYLLDGEIVFFVAWVGPHGSIELPCIVFAGVAGLIMAKAQWSLDGGTMWERVAKVRGEVLRALVGCASLLIIAGLIEGGFSQVNEPTLPYPIKITVASLLFATLCWYLFLMPLRPERLADATG